MAVPSRSRAELTAAGGGLKARAGRRRAPPTARRPRSAEQQHAPQADRAHEYAPIGEDGKAVPRDVVEHVADDEPGGDERGGKTERHRDPQLRSDKLAVLVKIVDEGAAHDGEREIGRAHV